MGLSSSSSCQATSSQCGSTRYFRALCFFFLKFSFLERRQKCWGWGECHPSVINREDFNCSMCPTSDPSTWTADDVYFEVACDGDVGTLSFKLDDLLETKWLESLTLELVYSTSNMEDVRVPVTPAMGTQEKYVAVQSRLCLSFDPGLSPTICGSCGATPTTTSEFLLHALLPPKLQRRGLVF